MLFATGHRMQTEAAVGAIELPGQIERKLRQRSAQKTQTLAGMVSRAQLDGFRRDVEGGHIASGVGEKHRVAAVATANFEHACIRCDAPKHDLGEAGGPQGHRGIAIVIGPVAAAPAIAFATTFESFAIIDDARRSLVGADFGKIVDHQVGVSRFVVEIPATADLRVHALRARVTQATLALGHPQVYLYRARDIAAHPFSYVVVHRNRRDDHGVLLCGKMAAQAKITARELHAVLALIAPFAGKDRAQIVTVEMYRGNTCGAQRRLHLARDRGLARTRIPGNPYHPYRHSRPRCKFANTILSVTRLHDSHHMGGPR